MMARRHMMHTCTSSLWLEEDFLCILLPSVELILCNTGATCETKQLLVPPVSVTLFEPQQQNFAPQLARNKQDPQPGHLTSQSVHEQLCSFRKSRSCWGSWSGPPRTSQQAFLCPTGCRHFQHFPRRTYRVFPAG